MFAATLGGTIAGVLHDPIVVFMLAVGLISGYLKAGPYFFAGLVSAAFVVRAGFSMFNLQGLGSIGFSMSLFAACVVGLMVGTVFALARGMRFVIDTPSTSKQSDD